MSFDLRVNHPQLEAAVDAMRGAVSAIDGRLQLLEGELMPLRHEWIGSAQQAYYVAKGRWDTAIADLTAVLNDAAAVVGAANMEYAAADRRGAANFSG
ncbi:MAG: WXG100 family type VII secretion target [Nocardioides sp.]|uniref:WXG100 family type VII secretion target n=1 Tax=Nocardioides sp. TaxID=35761 RepID=UPI0039E58FA5